MLQITELLNKHNLKDTVATDYYGNTALHLAIENTSLSQVEVMEILKILLDNKIDVNVENKYKQTALHLAVKHQLKDVIEFLIERKASTGTIPHYFVINEFAQFERLSMQGQELNDDEIQVLEAEGASFVEWLISKGFDFDCKNKKNQSALYLALHHNLQHILPTLLETTKDIDAVDEKYKSLLHVFLERNTDAFSNIARRYTPTYRCLTDDLKYYPICKNWYSERYAANIVKILLDRGTSASQVTEKDENGTTTIHVAAKRATGSVVRLLIERGADVNCRNNHKETPLHFAMENGENEFLVEITRALLEHGVDVDAKNLKGETALHKIADGPWSTGDESVNAMRMLLEHGANINELTREGGSILWYARSRNHHDFLHPINYFDDDYGGGSYSDVDEDIDEWAFDELKFLTDHSIKLKAASLAWDEEHEYFICHHWEYQPIVRKEYKESFSECLKEVETLKSTFINDLTSLYSLLHIDLNSRCAYIHNEELQQLVQSSKLQQQFPLYSVLIMASYHEAVARKSLLEPAKEAWLALTGIGLPGLCLECIFSFLSNADLLDMIERE